jgi:hypothetical protein
MATKVTDETKNSDVEVNTSLAPGLAGYLTAWAELHGKTLGQMVREEVELYQYQILDDQVRGADLLGEIFPGIDLEADAWIARHYPKEEKAPEEKAPEEKAPEEWVSASKLAEAEAKIAEYEKLFDFGDTVADETSDVEVTVTVSLPPALADYLTKYGKQNGESLAQVVRTTVENDVYAFIDSVDGPDTMNTLVPGIYEEVDAWHNQKAPGKESEAKDPAPDGKGPG